MWRNTVKNAACARARESIQNRLKVMITIGERKKTVLLRTSFSLLPSNQNSQHIQEKYFATIYFHV